MIAEWNGQPLPRRDTRPDSPMAGLQDGHAHVAWVEPGVFCLILLKLTVPLVKIKLAHD